MYTLHIPTPHDTKIHTYTIYFPHMEATWNLTQYSVWGVGGGMSSLMGIRYTITPSLYLRVHVHDSTIHGYPPTGNYIDGRRENSEPVPLRLRDGSIGGYTLFGLSLGLVGSGGAGTGCGKFPNPGGVDWLRQGTRPGKRVQGHRCLNQRGERPRCGVPV